MGFNKYGIMYGGDYNPEQWLKRPDLLQRDVELLRKAGINEATMGVFSWAALEPEEGVYRFDWLKERLDTLYENGIGTILSTPSGARPRWLAEKYPEVLRMNRSFVREHYGERQNHCWTSGIYREKTARINQKLAEAFSSHPGVIAWHISNELGGECCCPLCREAFRTWLKERYHSVDRLNEAWNNTFWSHTFQSFSQIEPPSPVGDHSLHGLELSWRRFVTDQATDFMKSEIEALRKGGAVQPVTTNFMYNFTGLNYHVLAKELDFISFDNYPLWGKYSDIQVARDCAFWYDVMRSFKKKPFYLMESCPSATNWQSVSKLKKPGLLQAASLQAVAHGSDSVQFFQLRSSRGASEKFHGAVIDHYGGEDTRVFREVCKLGEALKKLAPLAGTRTKSCCAVVYDWENRWALENAAGPRNKGMFYLESVQKHYHAMRKMGINVDLIAMDDDLGGYEVLALPMLYMFRCGMEEKIRSFISRGGLCIMTCWSGVVDEDDLCHLGGRPHNLMDVFGLRAEEIDALYDGEYNEAEISFEKAANTYTCTHLCDLFKPMEGTTVLGVYEKAFYAGYPAVTKHDYGAGSAYYVCADFEQRFYDDLYAFLLKDTNLQPVPGPLPEGLEVTMRETEDSEYLILQNFSDQPAALPLPEQSQPPTPILGKAEGYLESLESAVWKL